MINGYKKYYLSLKGYSYSDDKKIFDRISSLWLYHIIRPISFLISPLFIVLNISANTATYISFITGVISLYFGFMGDFLLSSFFYNAFWVLDCVDGNIARVTEATKTGEYIDAVVGDLINFLFIPFIGLGLYTNNSTFTLSFLFFTKNVFVLSLIASLIHLMAVLISQRKKIIFKKNKDKPTRIGNKNEVTTIELLIRNSFGVAFNAPISILFSSMNKIDLLIVYNLLTLPFILIYSIFRK